MLKKSKFLAMRSMSQHIISRPRVMGGLMALLAIALALIIGQAAVIGNTPVVVLVVSTIIATAIVSLFIVETNLMTKFVTSILCGLLITLLVDVAIAGAVTATTTEVGLLALIGVATAAFTVGNHSKIRDWMAKAIGHLGQTPMHSIKSSRGKIVVIESTGSHRHHAPTVTGSQHRIAA